MTFVNAGFDVHRSQITFDALDTATGELTSERIDSTPTAVGEWVGRFADREVHVALEACTGWYFVTRALETAGAVAHLAEVDEATSWRQRIQATLVHLASRRCPRASRAPGPGSGSKAASFPPPPASGSRSGFR